MRRRTAPSATPWRAFAPWLAGTALVWSARLALGDRWVPGAEVGLLAALGALAAACELRAGARERVELARLRRGGFVSAALAPTALVLALATWVLAQLATALAALALPPERRPWPAATERLLPLGAALFGAALTLALGRVLVLRAGPRAPRRGWLVACAVPAPLAVLGLTLAAPAEPAAALAACAATALASLALVALLARRHGTDVFPPAR